MLCKDIWTDESLSHLHPYSPKTTGHMKVCAPETHLGHLDATAYTNSTSYPHLQMCVHTNTWTHIQPQAFPYLLHVYFHKCVLIFLRTFQWNVLTFWDILSSFCIFSWNPMCYTYFYIIYFSNSKPKGQYTILFIKSTWWEWNPWLLLPNIPASSLWLNLEQNPQNCPMSSRTSCNDS